LNCATRLPIELHYTASKPAELARIIKRQLDGPLAWAALVWLSILGVLLFGAIALLERLTVPYAAAGHH